MAIPSSTGVGVAEAAAAAGTAREGQGSPRVGARFAILAGRSWVPPQRRRRHLCHTPVRVGGDETGDKHGIIVSLGAVTGGGLFEREPHAAEIDLLRLRNVGGDVLGILRLQQGAENVELGRDQFVVLKAVQVRDDGFDILLVEAVGKDDLAIFVRHLGARALGLEQAVYPGRAEIVAFGPAAVEAPLELVDGGDALQLGQMMHQNVAEHAVELRLGQEAGVGHRGQVVKQGVKLRREAARLFRVERAQADEDMSPILASDKRLGHLTAPVVNAVSTEEMSRGRHRAPQRCGAEVWRPGVAALRVSAPLGDALFPFQGLREVWLGREDSNLRMAESKSAALPLGDAPIRRRRRHGPGGKRGGQ